MVILEILGVIFFWLIMFLSIAVIPLGVPGTFIILLNALIYGWLTDFTDVTWGFLGVLLLISILAEVLEFFLGAAVAGRYGASRSGMFGAIIGGFVGALWATAILPIVGTLFGAFIGAFAGATLFEYLSTKDFDRAFNVGIGAFLGSLGGKLSKVAAAVAMTVMVGFRII